MKLNLSRIIELEFAPSEEKVHKPKIKKGKRDAKREKRFPRHRANRNMHT